MSIPALATVYDSLIALRRSGGAAGLTLVPDLARTLPRPADGGTTYTFTLRRGNPLLQRHARAGVRLPPRHPAPAQHRPAVGIPDYYDGILGARACQQHPKRCDLSAGIVTDDAAGTVTFRLAQADPDFLYKLALSSPPRPRPALPDRAISRAPFLPGTGPYMISQVQAERIRYPRAQPVLPPVVLRGPASGLPVRHPVRAGDQPEQAGIGGHRRPGRPDAPSLR